MTLAPSRRFATAILCTALSLSAAQAGVNRWTRGTPDWGPHHAASVWASPSRAAFVLAAAENGLFESDDGGLHWRPVNPRTLVTGLAVDESDPLTIYIQTHHDVEKSVDGGITWVPAQGGLPVGSGHPAFGLVNLPYAPETLFASVGEDLYRTLDGGNSWFPVLKAQSARTVIVDRSAPGVLYSLTNLSVLFRSFDGGDHWQSISANLPATYVSSLSVSGDGVVFAVGDGLLFRSENRGDSWNEMPTPFGIHFGVFADPFASGIVYVTESGPLGQDSLYRSSDGGVSWTTLPEVVPGSLNSLWFSPRPHELYAAAAGTIYHSQDAGDSWERAMTGPAPVAGQRLAVDSHDPQVLYATGGTNGLSRSDDGGLHWLTLGDAVPELQFVQGPVAAGPASGVVYADTVAGLHMSGDKGDSWSLVGTPAPLTELVIDRISNDILFAIEQVYCSPGLGCYYLPYKSEDGGKTWGPLAVPLGVSSVFNLILAPPPSTTLFMLDHSGALFSGPESGPLDRVSGAPPGLGVLAAEPVSGGALYGIADILYVSTDSGSTWSPLSAQGLPRYVIDLVVGPAGDLYAAAIDGVYRSADRGLSWDPIRDGLEEISVLSLAHSSDGKTLFAGTANAVYQYTVCDACPRRVGAERPHTRVIAPRPSD